MRGRGSEYVTPFKGRADRLAEDPRACDLVGTVAVGQGNDCGTISIGPACARERRREHAVVRANIDATCPPDRDGTPICPHAGIDDSDMDGVCREERPGRLREEGRLDDGLGRHVMGDVNYHGPRVQAKDHALHRRDVGVGGPEV
jgi:hypothetical protein